MARFLQGLKEKIPATVHQSIRDHYLEWSVFIKAMKIWKWGVWETAQDSCRIVFIGNTEQHLNAFSLFIGKDPEVTPVSGITSVRSLMGALMNRGIFPTILLTPAPIPGALRIPSHLTSLVPLRRTEEEIIAQLDPELRRRVRRMREQGFRIERVTNADDIKRINEEMILPFAQERHGDRAYSHSVETVSSIAQKGRLDRLLQGEEVVGAHLAYPYTARGTRRWCCERFGYPRSIFSDPKKLRDINAVNLHLACMKANEEGYDYYDIGVSPARPNDGLLQFKRRRKVIIEPLRFLPYFYAHFARESYTKVLSQSPLFSVEGEKLFLNVGVLRETDDTMLTDRFKEWGFRGIFAIRLYSERPIGSAVQAEIASKYADLGDTTSVEVHIS